MLLHRSPGHPGDPSSPDDRLRAALGATLGVLGAVTMDALGVWTVLGWQLAWVIVPAAVAASLLALSRWRRLLWPASATVLLAYVVIAGTRVVDGPVHGLIRHDSLPSTPVGAVVVLSDGVNADNLLHPDGLDRLLAGVELAQRGVAPRLVVTHVDERVGRLRLSTDADQLRIRRLVSGSFALLVTAPVHTTRDEALQSWALLAPLGVRAVVVVTSPVHTRRACATFERVGFVVTCVPAASRTVAVWRLLPPHARIEAFGLWLYETVGWMVYRQRGWL